MENLVPRDEIPQSWLEKSRCPYCSSAPMMINHTEGAPDHFICPTCELAFQVAQNQSSVFVLLDPVGTKTGFIGQWVEMKTLIERTRAANTVKEASQPQADKPIVRVDPQDMPDRDPIYEKYSPDIIDNAADLYELGNSKPKIKETLLQYSNLADEEIDEILTYISRKKIKLPGGLFSIPRWALGCIIVPFLCLISYGLIVFIQYQAASSFSPGADPRIVTVFKYENLPKGIRDIVPPEVQEMQMPEPLITKLDLTGDEVRACPADEDAATALYGGQAPDWKFNPLQKIWTLQSITAQKIIVPEGHLSVIPQLKQGLTIQLIPGPVRISNTYILIIRCP